MKVAVYARTNNNKQAELYYSSKLEKIQKYCNEKGFDIVEIYTDICASGTSMKRAQLTRLLSDSKAGKFNAIVVYDISRLTRNVCDFYTIKKNLRKYNILLFSCVDPHSGYDIATDDFQYLLNHFQKNHSNRKRGLQ